MKKIVSFVSVLLVGTLLMAGTSFANGSRPPLQTAEIAGGGVSQPMGELVTSHNPNGEDYAWSTGYTGHEFEAKAEGTKTAFVTAKGFSTVSADGTAFQKEINGGELSGAKATTKGFTTVGGFALGMDDSFCGHDAYAKVKLKVDGKLTQENGAYSDDRDSWAGGTNTSTVEFSGSSYDRDDRGWFAEAHGGIKAGGETTGGTLAWAKQTDDKATVWSVTGNTGSAWECGADRFKIETAGTGSVAGLAVLSNRTGFAEYSGTFEYNGGNKSWGITGGKATVQKVGQYGTSTSASAFSIVGAGGKRPMPDSRPE